MSKVYSPSCQIILWFWAVHTLCCFDDHLPHGRLRALGIRIRAYRLLVCISSWLWHYDANKTESIGCFPQIPIEHLRLNISARMRRWYHCFENAPHDKSDRAYHCAGILGITCSWLGSSVVQRGLAKKPSLSQRLFFKPSCEAVGIYIYILYYVYIYISIWIIDGFSIKQIIATGIFNCHVWSPQGSWSACDIIFMG